MKSVRFPIFFNYPPLFCDLTLFFAFMGIFGFTVSWGPMANFFLKLGLARAKGGLTGGQLGAFILLYDIVYIILYTFYNL